MYDTAVYGAGIGAGLIVVLTIWKGYVGVARGIVITVTASAIVLAVLQQVLPPWPLISVALCLAAMAWSLHSRGARVRSIERIAENDVAAAREESKALQEKSAQTQARLDGVDQSIAASHSIYEVSRDLGGVITMSELRRELGRLFVSLLSPNEVLLLYLDEEAGAPRFFRVFDLLEGGRVEIEALDEDHPVRGYFVDPTSRGIVAMDDGPGEPERAVIYLTHLDRVIGGIYLDGITIRKQLAMEPRVLLYTLAVLVNLASNKCILYLEIEQKSRHDALTGLYKRWYFLEVMAQEIGRSRAEGRSFVALMLDIDHFKDFNDTYGHLIGDQVLQMIGLFLKEHVRTQDIVCRYGGEEFVVALLDTDREGARIVAERLRASIAERPVSIAGGLTNITISVGGACFPDNEEDLLQLITLADEAMYRAKREGRNRVFFHDDP